MKISKYTFIILLFNFLFPLQISENFAIEVAENFYYSKNNPTTMEFAYESINVYNHNNNDIFYVVSLEPRGFILISSDNLVRPILGYSFDENFRFSDEIPENLNYLFNLYDEEISTRITENSYDINISQEWEKYSNFVNFEQSSRNVAPLIQARFDQGSAWNDMCPEDQDGPGGNVLVGCVAVSMAQVMHYWSYPEIGYGSHSYNHWDYGYQYANFGNAFYDYSQMPNNYASTETQELLYHCGVAVNMGYGTDGSGAQVFGGNPSTYHAMRNYFLFKNSMSQVFPENYSTSQYRNLLQDELDNNRPIIYVGYSSDGGHAWNIDGYDGDYFHNNWGWGGSQNGYFLLSSLNGFNSSQGALINIEPQSLNNPNIVLQDYIYIENQGDGDNVVNPGETIEMIVTVENLVPWDNASDIDMILSTQDPELTIINDYVSFNNLNAGDSYSNNSAPFTIEVSPNINLSVHELQLNIIGIGDNGEFDENEFYINIQINMEQAGFPYTLTLEDENGDEYSAATVVKSSPLLKDINNDNFPEIFFGDENGFFHGVDYNGNSINGFPYEIPGDGSKKIWGSPSSADIDNDGEIEFIFTSENKHCYVIDENGNIELDFESDQFLMATSSLANLDNDDDLEIVFYGYSSSGDVYAINHDGTFVQNFPVQLNEKVLKGGSVYDLNGNGKDDIVVATENEKLISIIYDDGTIDNIFSSEDKFKSAPTIIDHNGHILITAGDEGGKFYGINTDGSIEFVVITGNNVRSSAGLIEIDNNPVIFFGSEDGYLYAIDLNGNNINGWPQNVTEITGSNTILNINSSPVFADLDGDGDAEVITASENGYLIIFHLDGSPFQNYPIKLNYGFESSPTVMDIDNDNDQDVILGSLQNLTVIDIKESSNQEQFYWNTYRGDNKRTGTYITSGGLNGDVNFDGELNIQDLVILINMIIGNTETNFTGDMNSDGSVDVLDVVQLVNIILDVF